MQVKVDVTFFNYIYYVTLLSPSKIIKAVSARLTAHAFLHRRYTGIAVLNHGYIIAHLFKSACVGRDGTRVEEVLLKHMKGSHIQSQTGLTACSIQAE